MAEHKVPQDVEAEDKLLGPLSFRQFIYAMIALGAIALAYFLATSIAMPLFVVPLPVFLVFGTLAIPRKGQPMETYIGALIHFYFQPTRRIWDPDGQDSLVEITNPPIDTSPQTKDVGGAEAARRLSFLADLEDSQGWSTRIGNANLNDDFIADTTHVTDVFDDTSLNQALESRLAQSEQQVRSEAIAQMNAVTPPPTGPGSFAPAAYTPVTTPGTPPEPADDEAAISAMLKTSAANPMAAFHQTVIQPLWSSSATSSPTPAPTPVSNPAPAPTTANPESGIMDNRTIGTEEVISHGVGLDNSNTNQGGEISLH